MSHSIRGVERGRGVVTNGEGRHFEGHLNLTRSLADAWGLSAEQVVEAHARPARYVRVWHRDGFKWVPERTNAR